MVLLLLFLYVLLPSDCWAFDLYNIRMWPLFRSGDLETYEFEIRTPEEVKNVTNLSAISTLSGKGSKGAL